MISSKEKPTPAEKKEKISRSREYHRELLDFYKIPDFDYNVKYPWTKNGQKIVGLFPNEMTKKNGFYFEFVDSYLDPADVNRTVYKFNAVDNYENVYELMESGTYAVPVEELDIVRFEKTKADEFKIKVPIEVESHDDHFSKMTIKDFAAIVWQSPVSDKEWLNDLIQISKV